MINAYKLRDYFGCSHHMFVVFGDSCVRTYFLWLVCRILSKLQWNEQVLQENAGGSPRSWHVYGAFGRLRLKLEIFAVLLSSLQKLEQIAEKSTDKINVFWRIMWKAFLNWYSVKNGLLAGSGRLRHFNGNKICDEFEFYDLAINIKVIKNLKLGSSLIKLDMKVFYDSEKRALRKFQ